MRGCSQKLLFPGGLCAFRGCLSYLHGTKGKNLLKKNGNLFSFLQYSNFVLKLLTHVHKFSCGESEEGKKNICSHLKPCRFIFFSEVIILSII